MLIPVKPSRALLRSGPQGPRKVDKDVHVEVFPRRRPEQKKVGQAKTSGRTQIINRRGP
jgi:hypothetical protein